MGSGKERKVCFIASSGGHWEELMCLKSVAQKYDAFYVTEEGGQANDASANLDKICVIRVQIFILVSLLCEFVTFRRKKRT